MIVAPLLGHNLVRLLYLDEAGTDHDAPFLSVAGVLVHGDDEWPKVDQRIAGLVEKYIPERDRLGFVFHATDIYHGSGYFDRRKPEWADHIRRVTVLDDLADIIEDLHLPVVFGNYEKEKFALGPEGIANTHQRRASVLHDVAILDCLIRTDIWLARYAPSELATVIHEDGASLAKNLIKSTVRFARSPDHLKVVGTLPGLPLKRIIDTVHFAGKPDARPLQLADLCAFIMARGLKDKLVPQRAMEIIFRHLKWILQDEEKPNPPPMPEASDNSGKQPS